MGQINNNSHRLPERNVVLSDRVEDQADVGVDECELGMILATDQQGQVPSTVQQLQGCRHLRGG